MINWLLKYYPLVFLVFNGVFWLIVYVLHKTYAKRESVDNLEKEVLLIKTNINNLPDKDLVHKLELRIEELSGDIKRIEPGLISVKNLSDMLLENELKSKG
ncbi:hypothetical protein A9Q74_06235 [Colwellia sp. 39_35_sub15_T18]|nr:hypothetical protein A9Q74_06235 [Colwellia sp. 39_35_sub15_T18]